MAIIGPASGLIFAPVVNTATGLDIGPTFGLAGYTNPWRTSRSPAGRGKLITECSPRSTSRFQ